MILHFKTNCEYALNPEPVRIQKQMILIVHILTAGNLNSYVAHRSCGPFMYSLESATFEGVTLIRLELQGLLY